MSFWPRWLGGRGVPAPIDATRWVVLDVETTGLDMANDELLAIAAIAVRFDASGAAHDGGPPAPPRIALADSFEAVLRHDSASTDKDNILVHGIGVGAQRAGAPPSEVLTAFERWVGRSPLLAYHAAFDQAMLGRAARKHLGRVFINPWLDIAPVASGLYPEVRGQALDDWLAHFGIVCAVRHQAAADTLATAELLLRLWPGATARRCASFDGLTALARDQRWLARGG